MAKTGTLNFTVATIKANGIFGQWVLSRKSTSRGSEDIKVIEDIGENVALKLSIEVFFK
jgi:hypothetical protein